MNKTSAITGGAGILLAGVVAWAVFFQGMPKAGAYDAFAQCLTEKGVVMYGAEWCPHCQNQKKMFGSSFQFIKYVQCPLDPKKCLEEKIEGYPTWKFPDGRMFPGELKLEELSRESSCPLVQPSN